MNEWESRPSSGKNTSTNRLDAYQGCLLGGAVGDALGYPVEFSKEIKIFRTYGPRGITQYQLTQGVAEISDDTQMTLFTATALLAAETQSALRGGSPDYLSAFPQSYQEWLQTQLESYPMDPPPQVSWLSNLPQMFHAREPGRSCITALRQEVRGSIQHPINDSKGCGGVMRVAPIGLYLGGKGMDPEEMDLVGAQAAALSHGHPLGYLPAAALVHLVHLAAHRPELTLAQRVEEMEESIRRQFASSPYLPDFLALVDRAVELSQSGMGDLKAIHRLGKGWVAEETLAIALYCALKYPEDFEKAMVASVNHDGDSDSTGAVTGNILGAYLGKSAIPDQFLEHLELKDVILQVAQDLYEAGESGKEGDAGWRQRYGHAALPWGWEDRLG